MGIVSPQIYDTHYFQASLDQGSMRQLKTPLVSQQNSLEVASHHFNPSEVVQNTTKDSQIIKVQDVQMKDFNVRLKSFLKWPQCFSINGSQLAGAGFYFVGPGDRVKCAYCQKKVKHWEQDDDPMSEHQRISPDCSFVKMFASQPQHQLLTSVSRHSQWATSSCSTHSSSSSQCSAFQDIRSTDLQKDDFPSTGTLMEQAIYIIKMNTTLYEIQMLCNTLGIIEDSTLSRFV